MRTIIGILLCLSLVSCERYYAPNENQRDINNNLRQEAYPNPDSTFNVENNTHINIGTVLIHLVDSTNANISVADSGHFSTHIRDAPATCLVHGFPLVYALPTWVPIDTHTSVHVTWTSNVVIVDTSEVN